MNHVEYLQLEAIYRHAKNYVLEDDAKNANLKANVLAGIEQVKRNCVVLSGEYILFFLVLGIMWKKCEMLMVAKTNSEVSEILKPSLPYWDGGIFRVGRYHVLEEELLLWSKASLVAPLNNEGYQRYQQIFTELFPEQGKEFFG